ncbi:MAG: SMI1/KNR4 family protein [Hymenobacter sp.]|nr:MAG: SMI1/KNR4 family protein [Hymenobacter sp.]
MADYSFLSQYIVNDDNQSPTGTPLHKFYPVKKADLLKAEERLDFLLPDELTDFYNQIGYGSFYLGNDQFAFYRFLSPSQLSDIYLRTDYYEEDPDLDLYDDPDKLIFFEVMEGVYLTVDRISKNNVTSVYYIKDKISNSLEEFIISFSENPMILERYLE